MINDKFAGIEESPKDAADTFDGILSFLDMGLGSLDFIGRWEA